MSYKGTYDKTVFHNPENGYCVISVKTADTGIPEKARNPYRYRDHLLRFTATGYNLPLTDAVDFVLEGEWETTKHGYQLAVEHWQEIIPRTKEGVRAYLASGLIKGIGEKTAEAIVERFGVGALDILDQQPEKLLEVKGITESKLEDIKESYMESHVLRDLMTFLAPFKVTPKTAMKIQQEFGPTSVSIIRTKPYELCRISGFGFKKVDAIVLKTTCRPNDPMRIRGALLYCLNESRNKEGHLFMKTEDLCKNALTLLNQKLPLSQMHLQMRQVSDELYNTVMCGDLIANNSSIYLPPSFSAEDSVARRVAEMLLESNNSRDISSELTAVKKELGITLSRQQERAVDMVFRYNLSIITGSPGTGKTTVLQAVINVFQKVKASGKMLLAAPTGKASRRMAESTGISEAKTLHSALGLFTEADIYVNSTDPVDADLVIIDEFSMVDMWLASQLFTRLKSGTKVLMVGDADQLPSVGPGKVFREFISCGRIPVTVLDEIFRQSKDSLIAHNAKFILTNNTQLFYGNDFDFIRCKTQQEASWHIQRLYLDEITRVGIENVQVLSPFREEGVVSAEKLNESIRDLVNPSSEHTPELQVGKRIFRVNDRVIQKKNKRGISNGDVGFVRSIDYRARCPIVTIEFLENAPAQASQETVANAETTSAPEAPAAINLPDVSEQAGSGVTGLPDAPEQPEVQTEATTSADAFGQSEALAQDVTSERPQTADTPEEPFECGESAEKQDAVLEAQRYTTDTPVDEICALMTLEEAQAVIVDVGTCNGWTLGEVVERRPASLKWYLNGYPGENNMLRAGAKLLLENSLKRKAG